MLYVIKLFSEDASASTARTVVRMRGSEFSGTETVTTESVTKAGELSLISLMPTLTLAVDDLAAPVVGLSVAVIFKEKAAFWDVSVSRSNFTRLLISPEVESMLKKSLSGIE